MSRFIVLFVVASTFAFADVSALLKTVYRWSVTSPKPINYALKNKTHPRTGVPFTKAGYPKFKKVDTCNMDLSLFSRVKDRLSSSQNIRQKHFAICSHKLYSKVTANQALKMKFTASQIVQLRNGKTPDGYTWHHTEKKNILELVDREIHNKTAHSGGYSLYH